MINSSLFYYYYYYFGPSGTNRPNKIKPRKSPPLEIGMCFQFFFYLFKLNSTRLADFNFQREIGCWFWQYAIFSQIILYRGQKTKDFIFLYYFAKTLPKSISKIQNHTITFLHFLFFVFTHPHPSAFTIFIVCCDWWFKN